ncbi:amidase [Vreelandella arcis]|uniref:Aspartyl-tRNA(Asn)/glutamyl-tRNA(Gln) amidotransferase subunit A n=1 Tax=Vreelandella arcis TaxID=416873 RepID=A0A1H0CIC2_9GAMM|nr:amidase [Halomonas arcis]SDN57583.1 aspartyl-tRNA(Asn)/glutamyl-tRNA(Gln) amidotransferase subunit A [Halomonas arcis]
MLRQTMEATTSDINWLSAVELSVLFRSGELSPCEAVAASFSRIAAVDPHLNAFCALDEERAMRDAQHSETRFSAGVPLGPLDGVPVAIKDLTPTAGLRTAMGSRLFADNIPEHDAIVVERLRAAGAIIVGKTTTSEFANASVTDSPLTGSTCNPWDPSRSSGGSSGGSAVAVATGCVPLAEGSDMGGSVRIPACFCGVLGLKPALGRIPFALMPSLYDPIAHHGPLARSVDDIVAFLHVTAGPDDRDPISLPASTACDAPLASDLAGVRVAFSPDLGFLSVESDVMDNARAATKRLEEAGAVVETVDLGLSEALYDAGYKLFSARIYQYYGHLESAHRDVLDPTLLHFFDIGRSLSAADLVDTEMMVSREWQTMVRLFESYDVLACPTMPRTATPLGKSEFDFNGCDTEGKSITFDMTFPFNLFGRLPALTLPSGLGQDGLPTGLQLVGRRHDERTILSLAHILHAPDIWNARLRDLGPWTNKPTDGARK